MVVVRIAPRAIIRISNDQACRVHGDICRLSPSVYHVAFVKEMKESGRGTRAKRVREAEAVVRG